MTHLTSSAALQAQAEHPNYQACRSDGDDVARAPYERGIGSGRLVVPDAQQNPKATSRIKLSVVTRHGCRDTTPQGVAGH